MVYDNLLNDDSSQTGMVQKQKEYFLKTNDFLRMASGICYPGGCRFHDKNPS